MLKLQAPHVIKLKAGFTNLAFSTLFLSILAQPSFAIDKGQEPPARQSCAASLAASSQGPKLILRMKTKEAQASILSSNGNRDYRQAVEVKSAWLSLYAPENLKSGQYAFTAWAEPKNSSEPIVSIFSFLPSKAFPLLEGSSGHELTYDETQWFADGPRINGFLRWKVARHRLEITTLSTEDLGYQIALPGGVMAGYRVSARKMFIDYSEDFKTILHLKAVRSTALGKSKGTILGDSKDLEILDANFLSK